MFPHAEKSTVEKWLKIDWIRFTEVTAATISTSTKVEEKTTETIVNEAPDKVSNALDQMKCGDIWLGLTSYPVTLTSSEHSLNSEAQRYR